MSRGLGARQQLMFDWLQQQWAKGLQPKRSELLDAFIVDTNTVWRWDHAKRDELRKQGLEIYLKSPEILGHPDRPVLTPRPEAEAYRRALRTLVDRNLVKVVADADDFYRYCDPEAENPLLVVMRPGRYNETPVIGTECGRRRAPAISASERRRQALLSVLPTDGGWLGIEDLADAFWLAIGGRQEEIDKSRKRSCDRDQFKRTNGYSWLRTAMLQLKKAGKVEIGTIRSGQTEIEPKRYQEQKVAAVRLSVVQPQVTQAAGQRLAPMLVSVASGGPGSHSRNA